jgi:hypothetical protein
MLSHALSRVAEVSLPLPREESSVLLLIPLVLLLLLEYPVSSLHPAQVLLVAPREAGLHLLWPEVGEGRLRGLSIGLESGSGLCCLLLVPYALFSFFSLNFKLFIAKISA